MLDWLAGLFLNTGAVFASWFASKDDSSFAVLQLMTATLVLAAVVAVVVYWQSLVEYWRSHWSPRK